MFTGNQTKRLTHIVKLEMYFKTLDFERDTYFKVVQDRVMLLSVLLSFLKLWSLFPEFVSSALFSY